MLQVKVRDLSDGGSLAAAVSTLLAVSVLFVRKRDAFLNPQFWAEDGTVFFAQQYELGLESLLRSYAGYFHTVPRLVASFADLFPYAFAPAIYNYSALALLLVVVWKLHSRRLDLRHRHLMALAIVMVPHFTGEVFLSLTNIQWVLGPLLLLIALQREPENRTQGALDLLLVALCSLTGPFVLIMLPGLTGQAWRRRSGHAVTMLGVAAAAAAVQLTAMLRNPTVIAGSEEPTAEIWTRLIGQKLFGTMFLGRQTPYTIDAELLALGGFLAIAMLLALVWSDRPRRQLVLTLLVFAAAVTAAVFYKFKAAPELLIPAPAAARYFFIPNLMVLWSVLICLGLAETWRRALPLALAVLMTFSSFNSVFRTPAYKDFRWKAFAARIDEERPLAIPINPPGWTLPIDPEKRSVKEAQRGVRRP